MRIGIDIRCLQEGRRTGVEEYTLSLLKNMFSATSGSASGRNPDRKNEYVLFFNSWKKTDIDLGWTDAYPNIKIKKLGYPNKLLNLCIWYFGWPKIEKLIGEIDVFFMPNINFCSLSKKTKLVLTIHDLSFEMFPEHFSWKSRLWHFLINPKKLCQRADKIITVSDSTKNDVVNFYKIDPKKIETIHSSVSDEFRMIDRNEIRMVEVKKAYDLPYHFILYLGTMEPRKNIIGTIRAFNHLRSIKNLELDKYKLVIAGARGWKENGISKELKKSPFRNDILSLGFIESENKPYLYNLASLFVYPSFFEGFGFPPLEAMKCKVPVITSNGSSFPEIVGDAGILIDPERPDEISKAMQEILLDKDFGNKLKERGLKKANRFSWKTSAEKFLKIINDIGAKEN